MPEVQSSSRAPRHRARSVAVHAVLIAGSVVMLGPFLWELVTALKPFSETTQLPPTLLPHHWQLSNFTTVFRSLPFGRMFLNTVLMTVGRTVCQVAFSAMAGYAFARMRFRGSAVLFALFLSVLMVPGLVFLIPQYLIIEQLGWLNTLQGLIVPMMCSAFGTFMMRQFFMSLPTDIEEAARLDGANPWQVFWRVVLPLARPGLLALTILTVLSSWNDLMYPLIVNTDPQKMTLSAGLASLQGEHFTDYSVLMAGSLMATAPMIVIFVLLQRHFIQSIAFSGGK
ncbi:carbohydrate ABC transporter permease [Kitasatospora viridis]|uniref:Carbohydrate ABC transporter membrane protein 2 (CUT1 family) n=1 Tax=Kitasatospora viridis TaxID=281105 RepID=A0A561TSH0_9ACTN|nr:carbohydrate ABC transporter permease [Kitasatospora viridis]TWF90063.1 carbohydrate ABC transporter membrane protein 2 (CUT1 family) [Kitasatospora viridis]